MSTYTPRHSDADGSVRRGSYKPLHGGATVETPEKEKAPKTPRLKREKEPRAPREPKTKAPKAKASKQPKATNRPQKSRGAAKALNGLVAVLASIKILIFVGAGILIGLILTGYLFFTLGPKVETTYGSVDRSLDYPINNIPSGVTLVVMADGSPVPTGVERVLSPVLSNVVEVRVDRVERRGDADGYVATCTAGSCSVGAQVWFSTQAIVGEPTT